MTSTKPNRNTVPLDSRSLESKPEALPELNRIHICIDCHDVATDMLDNCEQCGSKVVVPYVSVREQMKRERAIAQRLRETIQRGWLIEMVSDIKKLIEELEKVK